LIIVAGKGLPNSPETNAFISITVDHEGNLWSATGKNGIGIGVLKFDGTEWQTISRENNPKFRTNDFHLVGSSGNSVYLSTWGWGFVRYQNDGYTVFDDQTTSLVGIPAANSFLTINNVQEDNVGNAWILNYWPGDGKTVNVLTPNDEVISYEFGSPLPATIINAINLVVDQNNTKWFIKHGGNCS